LGGQYDPRASAAFSDGPCLLGKSYHPSEIREFLEQGRIGYQYIENDAELLDQVVDRLQQGKVVGWFQDRSNGARAPSGIEAFSVIRGTPT
jgi:predicted NodU family carbamoyl transferase